MRIALLATAALAFGASTAHAATPECFGARARDPEARCENVRLNRVARPHPDDAPLEPSEPCEPLETRRPKVCSFGVTRAKARGVVGLVGDSHSTHWRAALAGVAKHRRWRGFSINRDACPFTLAPVPGTRCDGWARSVVRWLRSHREVTSVVVSANSGSGVVAVPGLTARSTKIRGYEDAWRALPSSVRTIYVLRDVPHMQTGTLPCVAKAVDRHRNPALRCAIPRDIALPEDLEAVAAETTDEERVRLIDLTNFMCDQASCFPVVGGALLIRDIGHLTRTFSASLGPFLGRAMARAATARNPASTR